MPGSARLRLVTGLVLVAYAATHLLNHAIGLISLDAMERGRGIFLAFWRAEPIEATLLLSLITHPLFALWSLWQRRSLRLRPHEIAQLVTGVLIPFWLVGHVLGTGIISELIEFSDTYSYYLNVIWPDGLLVQTILVTLVWSHGMIGVHRRLRLEPWYGRVRNIATVAAVVLPLLALAGVLSAGREWGRIETEQPAQAAALAEAQRWPDEATRDQVLGRTEDVITLVFVGLLALVLVGRVGRWLVERRRTVRLTYPGGRVVTVPRGVTVLEASRLRGIPHAAVCGGRGRCSTCRIRLGIGGDRLPPPGADERRVLQRIGAPPDVRLACQARPNADLTVTPLMPTDVGKGAALAPMNPARGTERTLAVLFADLRGFTQLSEGRLPYDVVFILNRYFAAMGAAIERHDGHLDKFIGDGVMAWFGLDAAPDRAARQALAAARAMGEALARLNRDLAGELDRPMRMGIGLHLGPAIVGEMGYAGALGLTVIGDTVNVASRLESLSKEHRAELVVSDRLVRAAGVTLDQAGRHTVEVRGRVAGLGVHIVAATASLPAPAVATPTHANLWQRLRRRLVPNADAPAITPGDSMAARHQVDELARAEQARAGAMADP